MPSDERVITEFSLPSAPAEHCLGMDPHFDGSVRVLYLSLIRPPLLEHTSESPNSARGGSTLTQKSRASRSGTQRAAKPSQKTAGEELGHQGTYEETGGLVYLSELGYGQTAS
jgi:hypothetical protein